MQVEYALEAVRKGTCAVRNNWYTIATLIYISRNTISGGCSGKGRGRVGSREEIRTTTSGSPNSQKSCYAWWTRLSCFLWLALSPSFNISFSYQLRFKGLTADGRVLIDKARMECQSSRLTIEDPVTIEYITRHIAGIQQVKLIGIILLNNISDPVWSCLEIYSVRRCPTIRYLYSDHWLRSKWHKTPSLHDGTEWDL